MFNLFDECVLRLTRGNSADISITLKDAYTGDPIVIKEGDSVLFTAKDKHGETVIKRTLTYADISPDDGHSLILQIIPEETMLTTGEYLYDVLLLTSDGQAITFISSSLVIEKAIGLYTDAGGGDNG